MGFSFAPSRTAGAVIARSGEERATLVRRVYALLFTGILVTIAAALYTASNPALLNAVLRHQIIMVLLVFGTLFVAQGASRTFPVNVGLMYLFNVIIGVWITPILLLYAREPGVIGEAALLTGSAFGALTIYSFVSRRDFSAWGSFFFVGLIVLIVASLLNFFFHSNTDRKSVV